jgi:hypothetical protein
MALVVPSPSVVETSQGAADAAAAAALQEDGGTTMAQR